MVEVDLEGEKNTYPAGLFLLSHFFFSQNKGGPPIDLPLATSASVNPYVLQRPSGWLAYTHFVNLGFSGMIGRYLDCFMYALVREYSSSEDKRVEWAYFQTTPTSRL